MRLVSLMVFQNKVDKWKKLKILILGIVKLKKMSSNIQLFGETEGKFNFDKVKKINENVNENKEKVNNSKKSQTLIPVMSPDNTIMIYWNIIISFMMIYGIIITPYKLAYIDDSNKLLNIIDDFVNYFFLIDIILNFNLSITKGNKIERRRKQIAINYLKTWFFIDLLGSFPFDLIFNHNSVSEQNSCRISQVFEAFKAKSFIENSQSDEAF